MAKQNSTKPVTPDFFDVDKEASARAQAAIAGGFRGALTVPKSAKVSQDKKGLTEYRRWSERVVITSAYRTTTQTGLLDVTVVAKIRQSDDNAGATVFGHFYLNMSRPVPANHEGMNDRSMGAIISLLQATGYMPAGGVLKATVLNKMFPLKNQPGAASPLNTKALVASIVQQFGPQKDRKTNKLVLDEDGEPIKEARDNIESFLPDAGPAAEVEEDEDE